MYLNFYGLREKPFTQRTARHSVSDSRASALPGWSVPCLSVAWRLARCDLSRLNSAIWRETW